MSRAPLDADRPIANEDEDLLGRGPLVEQLAGWVTRAPTADGFVIGLTGPWGSGKTSVLHLLAAGLGDDATVVWFEPWLFAEADQLVPRFFDEIAAQLAHGRGKRLRRLGSRMADYGAALSPAAGILLGPVGQLAAAPKQLAALQMASVSTQRQELRSALRDYGRRIVVLIDDIDRLDAREVREMLRLVKLVADLPGVVHVLSYDRSRVETALLQTGQEDGREYLQKIVQASLAVPPLSRERLRAMTLGWLNDAVGDRQPESWDPDAWAGLVEGGIDGYLKTLRDGRRLANMAPAALELCTDEVASMDVLALEAMRIFDPDIHEALPAAAHLLVGGSSASDFRSPDEIEAERDEKLRQLLARSSHPDATTTVLRELFPQLGGLLGGRYYSDDARWLAGKRVASRTVCNAICISR